MRVIERRAKRSVVFRVAVAVHVVIVVALVVTIADYFGLLPALIVAVLVTIAWVVWARYVDENDSLDQPAPRPAGPARFRDPEDEAS